MKKKTENNPQYRIEPAYNEEELNSQMNVVKVALLFIETPISIIFFIYHIYLENALEPNKQKYLEAYNTSYSSRVIKKKRKRTKLSQLNNGVDIMIECELYKKLSIGDLVVKPNKCDFLFYYEKRKNS